MNDRTDPACRGEVSTDLRRLFLSPRGGRNRQRLVRVDDEDGPMNANRIADRLGLDYATVRHHLDRLERADFVESRTDGYGARYAIAGRLACHWSAFEALPRLGR